ncbi:MAG: DUF6476 family protein [Armatimonadota bacterium]|nr:DUF6476 family protein [Armatimonadota bacterium]
MLRSRTTVLLTLVVVGVVVLAGCVAVVSFVRARLNLTPIPQAPPKFRIERQVLPDGVRNIRCSPNGGAYCIVTRGGGVYVFNRRGAVRYSVRLEDATAALVTDDAGCAVVYSERDPSRTLVTFLNSAGRRIWKLSVRGAVWCCDVFGDAHRAVFVVGTGKAYVYVVEISPGNVRYRRFRVPGAVSSIMLDRRDESVLVATWQRSSIGRYTLNGRCVWRIEGRPDLVYQVHATGFPDKAIAYGRPLVFGITGELCALAGGTVLWRRDIGSAACLDVVFACEGDCVCLAQESVISHEGRSVKEKRAVLLDGSGRVLADKGSLFFGVRPLMVTRQCGVLLCGNEKALFSMNSAGKLDKVAVLPSRVVDYAVSDNGELVLLECAGGILIRAVLLPL